MKKIIPIVLALCLVLCTAVSAETETNKFPAPGEGFDPSSMPIPEEGTENTETTETNPQQAEKFPGNMEGFRGNMGGFPMNMQTDATAEQDAGFFKTYSTPITSLVLLALAFVFVLLYKRKNY